MLVLVQCNECVLSHTVHVDEQSNREQTTRTKSSPPAGKCRLGHRRNVSDTSASSISLPGHQSAFRSVFIT